VLALVVEAAGLAARWSEHLITSMEMTGAIFCDTPLPDTVRWPDINHL
jgi:hypothetical protein